MGELDVSAYRDEEQLRLFTKRLLRDVKAFEQMLEDGVIESDVRRVGAEQEMFLVDRGMKPANLAPTLLEELDDPHYTPELAQFNLEFNLDPFLFEGDCLRRVEHQATELYARVREAARRHDGDVVLCGILPTLRKEDLSLENMTPRPRYHALNAALNQLRGGVFRLRIKGIDDLVFQHESIMMEACNTSFQVHLQVTAEDFARFYNVAQLIAAPLMACATNSPLLFGRRLWRETRLALFQQSVDTRGDELHQREIQPRVSFGTRWVEDSVLELFKEDIGRFRALIGADEDEDPFAAMAEGRVPRLLALRLHSGTVYRWNRACYGISEGKPHLRIENRLLPAGPTIPDEVANAALWLGLMHGVAEEVGDPREQFDFDDAKNNLLAAARLGLDAQLKWLDGRTHPTHDLLLGILMPIARRGLLRNGVDEADVDHYFGLIRERIIHEASGSAWQLRSYAKMRKNSPTSECMAALTHAMIRNQESGRPPHEWELAEPCDLSVPWSQQFKQVGSLMSTDPYTVSENELVDLAANMMDWWHIRHVPVEDEKHHLVGLVTHRALMRYAYDRPPGDDDRQVPVREIMEQDPVRVTPETRTLEAIELMRRKKISCLPVVDADDRLVGMVTEDNLIRIAAKLLEQKLRE